MDKSVAEQPFTGEAEDTSVQSKKGVVGFSLFLFIICVLAGCVHFIYHGNRVVVLQLAGFLLLGTAYALVLHQRTKDETHWQLLSASLLFAISLLIALNALYFFKKQPQFFYALSFCCAFLAPAVITEAWRQFQYLLSASKPLWYYTPDIPSEPIFVYLENKPVKVKLISDGRSQLIGSSAPVSLKLGMVFFYMVKEHSPASNWKAQFLNENGKPYAWTFYYLKFGIWKKYLHPEENLFENGIKSNALIIARRLN